MPPSLPRRLLQIGTGIVLGLALVALVILLTPPPPGEEAWDGASPPPAPYPAPELALEDLDGAPVRLAEFRGRTTVVFFGYSHCPDVCPATLLNLSGALDRMTPRERDRIRVVFVTVDPERDTPERLRSWLANFHPEIVALRADDEEEVWQQAGRWGVHAARSPVATGAEGDDHAQHHHDPGPQGLPDGIEAVTLPGAPGAYGVDHSTRSFVLDRQGRIVLFLAPFQGAESMLLDLRRVLR
jgi:protein SCO1/2